jgi:lipopolysaccharide export LptBFGC system permease protein LptF
MAQLNKNNELTPIRASGISLYRTLAPVFLVAVIATAVSFLNQELVIPSLVDELRSTESMLDVGKKSVLGRLNLRDEEGNAWVIQGFLRGEEIMQNLLVTANPPGTAEARVYVTAETGKWKRTASDGKPRWHLSNGTELRFKGHDRLAASEGDYDVRFGEDGYVVLLPDDKNNDPYRLVSSFTPRDMIPAEVGLAYQSSAHLRGLYAEEPTRRDLSMLIQGRYAFPFANIVLLLIGLPFVLGVEGKSAFAGLIVCIVICGAFYGTWALCNELGKEILSPPAAAWLPIAVFGPMGIFLFDWVRT